MPKLKDFSALLFDVDLTLVNSHKEIPPRIPELLERLHKEGYQIGVCTGRSFPALGVHIPPLFPNEALHIIATGGQLVTNTGEVKAEHSIDTKKSQEIAKKLLEAGASVIVTRTEALYVSEDMLENLAKHPWKIPFKSLSEIPDWTSPTIVAYNPTEEVVELLKNRSDLHVNFLQPRNYALYADITLKEVTKARGLLDWEKASGISLDKVIGFGDSPNDNDFLESVGWAVAMGNATPQLKQVADTVIGDVDEDGLAMYLEKILAGGDL